MNEHYLTKYMALSTRCQETALEVIYD